MLYTMIVEQDFLGTFLGTFPDLPGCEVEGENAQAAVHAWPAEEGLGALRAPEDREPDCGDPRRVPMLVEIAELA